MCAGLHALINEEDLSVFPDVKGPARGILAFAANHAVGLGRFASGVAQDWVIQFEGFSEFFVRLRGVATSGKISDVELADFLAARTERLAFSRSAPGKGFGKPGEHNRLFAFEVGELVGLAVAARKGEIRGWIAGLQGIRCVGGNRSQPEEGERRQA